MNFEYLLYQYLLKHNRAEVPEFGVFELTKESAKIDAENSIIIPPKETISFQYNVSVYDSHLAKYIAEETNSNLFIVQTDLKSEVARWFQKLQKDSLLDLENLGQFQLDKQNNVVKITDNNADVFGFEEINLQQLKNKKPENTHIEDYTFNKGVIWTFLSIIVVGTATLFFFGDQELIFGKSSKIPTKKIVEKIVVKKVLTTPKIDSTKIDSIKPTTNAKIQKTNR
jgi:nucleoid DNA-binding protein